MNCDFGQLTNEPCTELAWATIPTPGSEFADELNLCTKHYHLYLRLTEATI